MNTSATKTYNLADKIESICCIVLILTSISSFIFMFKNYEGILAWIAVIGLLVSVFVGFTANVIKNYIKATELNYDE